MLQVLKTQAILRQLNDFRSQRDVVREKNLYIRATPAF
jgi:hypothetical protein